MEFWRTARTKAPTMSSWSPGWRENCVTAILHSSAIRFNLSHKRGIERVITALGREREFIRKASSMLIATVSAETGYSRRALPRSRRDELENRCRRISHCKG